MLPLVEKVEIVVSAGCWVSGPLLLPRKFERRAAGALLAVGCCWAAAKEGRYRKPGSFADPRPSWVLTMTADLTIA